MHVRKNDLVQVLSGGSKRGYYRGKRARVLTVLPKKGLVRLEGLFLVRRSLKAQRSREMPAGGIIEKPRAIPACKVLPVCGRCDKPARVRYAVLADGKKHRVCHRCNEAL